MLLSELALLEANARHKELLAEAARYRLANEARRGRPRHRPLLAVLAMVHRTRPARPATTATTEVPGQPLPVAEIGGH